MTAVGEPGTAECPWAKQARVGGGEASWYFSFSPPTLIRRMSFQNLLVVPDIDDPVGLASIFFSLSAARLSCPITTSVGVPG